MGTNDGRPPQKTPPAGTSSSPGLVRSGPSPGLFFLAFYTAETIIEGGWEIIITHTNTCLFSLIVFNWHCLIIRRSKKKNQTVMDRFSHCSQQWANSSQQRIIK